MVNGYNCTCLLGYICEFQHVMNMVNGYNCTCRPGYTGEFQHVMTWSMGTTVPVFLTTLVSFNMKWHGHWVQLYLSSWLHVSFNMKWHGQWVQLYLSSWLHWWVSTWNGHDMVTGYNCICLLDYTGEFQHVMTWSVGTTVSVFLTTLVSFNM